MTPVSEDSISPSAPAQHDVVEVIDLRSGSSVTAEVEHARDGVWRLVFDLAARVPQAASVHWDDGDSGWRAPAQLDRLDNTTARFVIAPVADWEPAPVLRSRRTPVDSAPMLVRIIQSTVLPSGRQVHAVCLDISDSGCRASWPGPPPHVGDSVEIAWETDARHHGVEPQWIRAQIARITPRPFGGRHVGLAFDATDPMHATRIRAWHRTWLDAHRQRAAPTHRHV